MSLAHALTPPRMNANPFRALLVTVLMAVHGFVSVVSCMATAEPAMAPACGMKCCAPGACDCAANPADTPSKPAPAAPLPAAQKLLASLCPALGNTFVPQAPRALTSALAAHAGERRATVPAPQLYTLHCSFLI